MNAKQGGKINKCKLCGEHEKLSKSHILPRFLHKSLLDEKHTMCAIGPGGLEKPSRLQDGVWERILCESCESKLSKIEKHASEVLFNLPPMRELKPGATARVHCDYKTFKLFGLSLIWRMGVSSNSTFDAVQLGPLEDRITKMVLSEDPGHALDYPFLLIRHQGGGPFERFLLPPKPRRRFFDWQFYPCFFAGLWWLFFVSGHTRQMKWHTAFLSPEGRLPIHICNANFAEFLDRVRRRVVVATASADPLKRVPRSSQPR